MHHLKDFLPDPACTLLFIGYQAEGTLGRHLQSGGKTARIDHAEYEVRCKVVSISGFSAHADVNELTAWLAHFAGSVPGTDASPARPRRVFLVHGDPDATAPFAERLRRELGLDVHIPSYREIVNLS
jgi:metallo-beta-lactamase family protein